ncbi:hypothetical protein [Arthrobacter sp. Y81]|uniref:hypothetical protein n=1 Tax=Arthrobacter sp. Y81 TaxID=2058897 RepID=UPI000CE2C0CE|nr:hypothetical protein [Arthrobacter sp. Y81]
MGIINRYVQLPAQPPGPWIVSLFRSPDRYWEFMADVAAAVVCGPAMEAARPMNATARSGYRPRPPSWWERFSHARQELK